MSACAWLNSRSAQWRGGRLSSRGKMLTATGMSTACRLAPQLSQYSRADEAADEQKHAAVDHVRRGVLCGVVLAVERRPPPTEGTPELADIEKAASKAPPAVRNLLNELVGLYKAGGLSADEFRRMIDYLADLDKGARFSATQIKANAEELWKTVPAAAQAGKALELFKAATNKRAGEEAQAAALIELKRLFPEAASAAGILADGLADVGAAAQGTASSLDVFKAGLSAIQSVTGASDRLAKANANLAKLGQRDTKTIESSYQRIIDAKQRLDDILAGDGNDLNQESPAAQEARARAKLMDANVRLAANPQDAAAQTQKDEAISQIEAAQRRGQEVAKSAQDTARHARAGSQRASRPRSGSSRRTAGCRRQGRGGGCRRT